MSGVLILAGAVIVVLLARWVARAGERGPHPAAPPGGPETVESLLAAGRKIEAIKLLRQQTGFGLKEAKEAIEAHAAGRPLPRASNPAPLVFGTGPESDPVLRRLLQQGDAIAAIKRYRELTGVGLQEAKDAVERLGGTS